MNPMIRAARHVLVPAWLLCAPGFALAQEAAPEPEAPAAAPAEKPKPKRAPAPRPVKQAPKVAEKAHPAAPAPAKAVWPEGASTVSEVYGDWTVNCARPQDPGTGPAVICSLMQSQGDAKTGRRTFAFELRSPKDGRAEGIILMPFGLSIEDGVSFKLDDTVLGKGAVYSTCGGDGCFVPISLPTLATDTMRNATTLSVTAQKPDAKEPLVVKVPLAGFAAAFDRMVAFGG